jgi:7-carboxy-7-deazaguanine synthase
MSILAHKQTRSPKNSKKYAVKEVFGTLQGEGRNAGAPSVFLRFAGCNLGYAVCSWCDTDWLKAEFSLSAADLVNLVASTRADAFGQNPRDLLLVATGGEPSLQFDPPLAALLREAGFRIAMETNGSREIHRGLVDWLTVSPKQREFVQKAGDELKIVFTGSRIDGLTPDVESVAQLSEGTSFDHYYLQPLDLGAAGINYEETVDAVMKLGSPWRLSLQLHKVAGIR